MCDTGYLCHEDLCEHQWQRESRSNMGAGYSDMEIEFPVLLR